MTDNTATQNEGLWLPHDLWATIAKLLDNDDLAKFRQLCKDTQFVGSQVAILQPLYNRLYGMDKTLPPFLPQERTLLAFQQAFEKVQTHQQSEIAYLTQHHPNLLEKSEYVEALLKIAPITLASLEIRNNILDNINIDIITAEIDVNSRLLYLNDAHITRLPITLFQVGPYLNFWHNLTHLFCSNNQLTTLDVKGLTKLKNLACDNNQLTMLNIQGQAKLKRLYCENNQLGTQNVQGLVLLQTLVCNNNRLSALNVQGLLVLQNLDCDNNPLESLNLKGVHPDTKKKYVELAKSLRFKQLSHPSDEAIAERTSPTFLPSFEANNPSSENTELKRKRDKEEEHGDEPEAKRLKKG